MLLSQTAIRGFFRRDDALAQLRELHAEVAAKLVEQGAEATFLVLDVATQKVVERLSWELLKTPGASLGSVGAPALLDLCIAGATHKLLGISAPYKVLEDLMEGQTLGNCEKLWALLESRREKLTTVR